MTTRQTFLNRTTALVCFTALGAMLGACGGGGGSQVASTPPPPPSPPAPPPPPPLGAPTVALLAGERSPSPAPFTHRPVGRP